MSNDIAKLTVDGKEYFYKKEEWEALTKFMGSRSQMSSITFMANQMFGTETPTKYSFTDDRSITLKEILDGDLGKGTTGETR